MATDDALSTADSALTYAALCTQILQKPCFNGPNGAAWQQTMGSAMDVNVDRLYYAVQCRFPSAAPSDALYYIANERGLERTIVIGTGGVQEPEADHRARLKAAWSVWAESGSQQGHVDEMNWCGLNAVTVLRRQEFSSPPPVGGPYVRAFARQVWSQFDVLVRKPLPIAPLVWGSGWHYGDGSTFGTTMSAAEIEQIRRLIREHKSAHNTATYLHLSFDGGPIWGTFRFGDGTQYGGLNAVTTIIIGEAEWNRRGLS